MCNDSTFFLLSKEEKNRYAAFARAKGIDKNLVAKNFIEKISYAPDVITISFLLKDNSALALDGKNYAPDQSIEKYAPVLKTEKPASFEEPVVRSCFQTCPSDNPATFKTLLPNIVHQSKKMNLGVQADA